MLKYWFLSIWVVFISCKHDDTIGTSIIPEGTNNPPFFSDSFALVPFSIREDSLRTDELGSNIAGYMDVADFGSSNHSFSFQVELENNDLSFGTNPILDSIVLQLAYNGSYGDLSSNSGLIIQVFSLEERIYKDSTYYSQYPLAHDNTPLGQANMSGINLEDSVEVNGIMTSPHLRIRLDSILGQDILNESDQSVLSDNESFFDFFAGLHIAADSNQGNAMLYFDLKDDISALKLYYHNADSNGIIAEFKVDNDAATHAHFTHNFSGSVAENYILNPDTLKGDSLLFLQSNAGLKAKIKLPELDSLGHVIINKAELVLTAESSTSSSDFTLPSKLICLAIDSNGQNDFVDDQFESSSYYGGDKIETTVNGISVNQYRFNLAYHMQALVNKEKENHGLYILTFPSNEIADHLVLKGTQENGIYLDLTYTKIK